MKRFTLALLALFTTSAASAAIDPNWPAALQASYAALGARQYQKALDIDEALIQDMFLRLAPGPAETKLFGSVVANKAIAFSGLGRADDAQWYWAVARSISHDVETIDLNTYGAAGEGLKPLLVDPSAMPRRVGGEVRAPVVLKRVEPVYPEAARKARVSGIVILECVIDRTGVVRSAVVLKSLDVPTLAYAATEALRQWRFIPATVDGRPIDVFFNLTINFKLVAEEDEQK